MKILLDGGPYDGRLIEWDGPSLQLPRKPVGNFAVTQLHAEDLRKAPPSDLWPVRYERTFPREYRLVVSERTCFEPGTPLSEAVVPHVSAVLYRVTP